MSTLCEQTRRAIVDREPLSDDQRKHLEACSTCGLHAGFSQLVRNPGRARGIDPAFLDVLEDHLETRELLLDRYRLEARLGAGAQGAVFRAVDVQLDCVVALKFVLLGGAAVGEVALGRELKHDHVCRINYAVLLDDHLLIDMEYIAGPTLAHAMPSLSLSERLDVFLGVCAGIRALHDRKILHLDIKPSNVVLRDGRTPVVTDFGLGGRIGDRPRGGTHGYMAPEQERGGEVGVAADVYALGKLLGVLLGAEAKTEATGALAAIVTRATADAPGERFADVAALAQATDLARRAPAPDRRKRRAVAIALGLLTGAGALAAGLALRAQRGGEVVSRRSSAKLVVMHGMGGNGTFLPGAEVYDSALGTWVAMPDDPVGVGLRARGLCRAGAAPLGPGRVLVFGGGGASGCSDNATTTRQTRILDVVAGSWTVPECQPPCIRLDNGRTYAPRGDGRSWGVASCDPVGPCLSYGRNTFPTVLLGDGAILAFGGCAGGCNGPNELAQTLGGAFELGRRGEIYRPRPGRPDATGAADLAGAIGGSWEQTPVALAPRRAGGVAIPVGDRVLVCGGSDGFRETLATCEEFDLNSSFNGNPRPWQEAGQTPSPVIALAPLPSGAIALLAGDDERAWIWESGAWTAGPPLAEPVHGAVLTALADGRVIASGGTRGDHALRAAQIFDPSLRAWTRLPAMRAARSGHAAVLLDDGRVVAVGGCAPALASAEAFDPGAMAWTELPPMSAARCGPLVVALH